MKKKIITVSVAILLVAIVAAAIILALPHRIDHTLTGIRFPSDDETAARECTVEFDGEIRKNEFRGRLTVDGDHFDVRIDLKGHTRTVHTYLGNELVTYAVIHAWENDLSKIAFEIQESDEYVICGMTLEEFESIMSENNYQLKYKRNGATN